MQTKLLLVLLKSRQKKKNNFFLTNLKQCCYIKPWCRCAFLPEDYKNKILHKRHKIVFCVCVFFFPRRETFQVNLNGYKNKLKICQTMKLMLTNKIASISSG